MNLPIVVESLSHSRAAMPDHFQLELPEPDPNEEQLEVEPSPDAFGSSSSDDRSPAECDAPGEPDQRRSFFARDPAPPKSIADYQRVAEPSPDADDIWREHAGEVDQRIIFSISEILQLMAMLAVVLTFARFFTRSILAGVLGVLVLVGLGLLSVERRPRFYYLAWGTLLAAYILIAVWAALETER